LATSLGHRTQRADRLRDHGDPDHDEDGQNGDDTYENHDESGHGRVASLRR
jgi:hypothetical protein